MDDIGNPTVMLPHAGMALVTALGFLLVLTLLCTFGMQQARLDYRMAGNARFQTQALANAEFVLAAAEADLAALAGDPFHPDRPGDAYYPQATRDFDPGTPGLQQPANRVWTFASTPVSLPDIDGDGSDSDGDGNADDGTGQYVIQDAGGELVLTGPVPHGGMPAALGGSPRQAFLVTARSHVPGGAQRTVQSVYVRAPLATGTGGAATSPTPVTVPAAALTDPAQGRRSWIDLRE
jgi:hypothetical protein